MGMEPGMGNGDGKWGWEVGIERYPVPGDVSIIQATTIYLTAHPTTQTSHFLTWTGDVTGYGIGNGKYELKSNPRSIKFTLKAALFILACL